VRTQLSSADSTFPEDEALPTTPYVHFTGDGKKRPGFLSSQV